MMAFQEDGIDPVKAINALRKIKSKLTNLKGKPVDQYISIKLLNAKLEAIMDMISIMSLK